MKFRTSKDIFIFCDNLVVEQRYNIPLKYRVQHFYSGSVDVLENKAETKTFVSMTA